MDWKTYILYFVVGGVIVSTITYFGSQGKGLTAAFIANLPSISLLTFLTIYLSAGGNAVSSYARGVILMLPPWILYILCAILLTPKIGFYPSIILGVLLYTATALVVIKLF